MRHHHERAELIIDHHQATSFFYHTERDQKVIKKGTEKDEKT